MTKLDEIKKRYDRYVDKGGAGRLFGYDGGMDGLLADFGDVIATAEDQDRMLSRASQDSEAVALGRDEAVRTVRSWNEKKRATPIPPDNGYVVSMLTNDLEALLANRIEITDRRPRTEELLDLLWELKKLRTVWKETGSHEALDRLLDLLEG